MAFNNKIEETEMTACKYWDCGFCYAPLGVENNAHTGECNEPLFCPYLISQMTDEPVKYETPMTAIEDIEAQIKVLQSKLEFYKELESYKTPCQEAFKRVYGKYPTDEPYWYAFKYGYDCAQGDYKVGEFQEPVKDEVSLYKRFEKEGAYGRLRYDDAIKVTREFLLDEAVIENEDHEYITFTLQKSLLEVSNENV